MIKDTYLLASSSPFHLSPGEDKTIHLALKKRKKRRRCKPIRRARKITVSLCIVIKKNGKLIRQRFRVVLPTSKAHLLRSSNPLQLLGNQKETIARLKNPRSKGKLKVNVFLAIRVSGIVVRQRFTCNV